MGVLKISPDRLPWRTTSRVGILGLLVGITMKTVRWGKERLAEEAHTREEASQ
jgi:hypothetical protein